MKKLILIILISGLFSCRKDKPEENKPDVIPEIIPYSGVFVTNEGNYGWGNASVSYLDFKSGQVTEDIFRAANGRPLGDVCQSMALYNNNAYLVINTSNKVEVVDSETFVSKGTIQGLTSPRYFLGIDPAKAYVTDLYSNSISVVDLNLMTKVKDIPCHGWTEELIMADTKVFVTNIRKEYVYVVDSNSDIITDSIKVRLGSNSLKKDKNGKLWVMCSGNRETNEASALYKINPASNQIETTLVFNDPSRGAGNLTISGSGDMLYYLSRGVNQLPIDASVLPENAFIPEAGKIFYGLNIDPHSGDIFVSDAIDYVQKGTVIRYKKDGSWINSYKVGIIPGGFCFY